MTASNDYGEGRNNPRSGNEALIDQSGRQRYRVVMAARPADC